MQLIESIVTKKGDKLGDRQIRSVTPISTDKIYEKILRGPDGERPRQAEKAVALCRRAWRVVHRLYPAEFNRDVPNPWDGVTIKRRVKAKLAGILRWRDYRGKEWPSAIKILHHKTGAVVWHPLEETGETATIQFYAEAEAILAQLPRRGVPMLLREVKTRNGAVFKPFSYSGFEKIVQQLRKQIEGVPSYFTLDACRHGGMTELEEAALTEGQGRALSGHKTAQAYRGYAKETFDRALSATRKRHAHRMANTQSTSVQNEGQISVQNGAEEQKASDAN